MDSFSPSTARLRACSGLTLSRVERVRRRMPRLFSHGSNGKWSARQDLHPRFLGPKPSVLLLHYALDTPDGLSRRRGHGGHGNTNLGDMFRGETLADPKGVAPSTLPPTTGRSAD